MSCTDCISNQAGSYAFFESLRKADGDQLLPLSGSIELTLRCNVRCKHCYILYPGATDGEMSTQQVKDVLDTLEKNGVMLLLVSGGEPLTRPDFKEIWIYAKRLGFLLTLYTNATLIDKEMARFLAKWPPRHAEITIYGHTEATYEAVTGVRGSFDRFRRGVALLLGHGVRVSLKTMVLKTNVHEFGAMKAWAEGLGCRFRWDTMINPKIDRDMGPTAERLDPEELAAFEAAIDGAKETYRNYGKIIRETATSDALFACGAGVKTFHVDPRGKLHPCMLWRESPYDLLGRSLEEGWQDHVRQLRDMKAPEDGCNGCNQRGLCGRCPAASLLEMGDPARSVPYHCQVGEAREKRLGAREPEIEFPPWPTRKKAGASMHPRAEAALHP